MIDWSRYDYQSLKNGEYLLCILGYPGNNSGGLILQYVVAQYETSKFFINTPDEGDVNLKDFIEYDKIIAFVNIKEIEFDNPWVVWDETLLVSNGNIFIVNYIREKEKYFHIDHYRNDTEVEKEVLQNYCIINPPPDDWE